MVHILDGTLENLWYLYYMVPQKSHGTYIRWYLRNIIALMYIRWYLRNPMLDGNSGIPWYLC